MATVVEPTIHADPNQYVRFDYVNWRDEHHTYEGHVLGVAYGRYDKDGRNDDAGLTWVMHVYVVRRDGKMKPGRRTFLLYKVHSLQDGIDPETLTEDEPDGPNDHTPAA